MLVELQTQNLLELHNTIVSVTTYKNLVELQTQRLLELHNTKFSGTTQHKC
jgi:hypothetical protein